MTEVGEDGETNTARPWATWVALAACVAIFLGVHASDSAGSLEGMRRWGYASALDVWRGSWWALVTSAFVHIEIMHLAFNLYWLWVLGRVLERAVGHVAWVLLCLSAAFVSSAGQLAWSDVTGIGFSGVGYAFFGFMLIGRRRWPAFARALNRDRIGLFLAWLVICFVLTRAGAWNVANAAHAHGLIYGLLVGSAAVSTRRRLFATGASAIVLAAVSVLFYAPWSATWNSDRAYDLHVKKDYPAAERHYLRALDLGFDPPWIWGNLVRLYQATGDTQHYERALAHLRACAPGKAKELERPTK